MNACCVDKACKSNAFSCVANEVVTRRITCPKVRDNLEKSRIIPDRPFYDLGRVKIYRFGNGLRGIS